MDGALLVAQHDGAQVDLLDQPALPVDDRVVADAHLVFEDDEEAGDHVAHQGLGAEADRQAGDAGAGQRRRDVDAELAQHHQPGDDRDGDGQRLLNEPAERLRALGALDDVLSGAGAHLPLEPARRRRSDADRHVGGNADHGDSKSMVEQPPHHRFAIDDAAAIARQRQRRQRQRHGRNQEDEQADQPAGAIHEARLALVGNDGAQDRLRGTRHQVGDEVSSDERQR